VTLLRWSDRTCLTCGVSVRAVTNGTCSAAQIARSEWAKSYGALDGLVTQTDLLEALAGEIPDGHGADPAVVERDDGSFLVDGVTPVDEAFDRLGLSKAPASPDYRTLAGFVLSRLGRIPVLRKPDCPGPRGLSL
jgi:CBS domain containing-hemolysin-like protein